ncbi:uncharacterized protein V1510DRAFT_402036 [Dipodascopsis tothii]|uniref:uncharacterized protein n=1 Tax=Dipodascopsis tothii TaxID=44089 RepID=UPI0034CDE0A9
MTSKQDTRRPRKTPAGSWDHDRFRGSEASQALAARVAPAGKLSKGPKPPGKAKPAPLAANALAARIGKPAGKLTKGGKAAGGAAGGNPASPAAAGAAGTAAAARKGALAAQLANNPLFAALNGGRPAAKAKKPAKPARPATAPAAAPPVAIRGAAAPRQAFEIKGSGGPTVVRIANLADGTSREDMMTFLSSAGAKLQACAVGQGAFNSMVADVLFADRAAADACVAQLHGAHADGHVLTAAVLRKDLSLLAAMFESTPPPPQLSFAERASHPPAVRRGRGFK